MSSRYDTELPRARINIQVDIDKGRGGEKTELPFNLLALGNFSPNMASSPLNDREPINVNRDNFDEVIARLTPSLNLCIENTFKPKHADLTVSLSFDSMKSFHPDQIVQKVPHLRRLIAMRNLLKDLRSNIIDDTKMRMSIEKILSEKTSVIKLRKELGEPNS